MTSVLATCVFSVSAHATTPLEKIPVVVKSHCFDLDRCLDLALGRATDPAEVERRLEALSSVELPEAFERQCHGSPVICMDWLARRTADGAPPIDVVYAAVAELAADSSHSHCARLPITCALVLEDEDRFEAKARVRRSPRSGHGPVSFRPKKHSSRR